jgi:hypothetical protein
MKNGCCRSSPSGAVITGSLWTRSVLRALSWVVPGVVLAAMPKCPLCLAAYVALFAGFGISMEVASFAWWLVAIGCIVALLYLPINSVRHLLT